LEILVFAVGKKLGLGLDVVDTIEDIGREGWREGRDERERGRE